MNWTQLPLGPLQTNCYVLSNKENECIIFDPGAEGDKLVQWLKANKLTPLAVLLTHAHFDHIGAVDAVRDAYDAPVYLHKKERNWLKDPAMNGSQFFKMGKISGRGADHLLEDETELTIGSFTFKLFHTPGHSPGSISFYFEEGGAVFAGDTLFMGSIGRTDLKGGNHELLIKSIHDHLLSLPEETVVLPGHGPATSIGQEMDHNPFLNGFA
ncbi:glyoxylase-like metal-dependent hydrolase (beta-lactamase superfamily II) [Bacillus ectoiniformans]|uniref:MBL fold metallo-hydrolase n=1 Tax=Bacillus ectoiniformans TaxID=1494429 RepID=UPI00195B20EE|nr:MBL fold metallo-hydrolase [Bacillus ectoiniformans]MBM7650054.1 glyoxylase-like metal-dependent hydrolase (beta-lactamase superfamily II) [Bacillus ectoiniformans]